MVQPWWSTVCWWRFDPYHSEQRGLDVEQQLPPTKKVPVLIWERVVQHGPFVICFRFRSSFRLGPCRFHQRVDRRQEKRFHHIDEGLTGPDPKPLLPDHSAIHKGQPELPKIAIPELPISKSTVKRFTGRKSHADMVSRLRLWRSDCGAWPRTLTWLSGQDLGQ